MCLWVSEYIFKTGVDLWTNERALNTQNREKKKNHNQCVIWLCTSEYVCVLNWLRSAYESIADHIVTFYGLLC